MHSVQIDDLEMMKYPKTEKIQCLRCFVLLRRQMKLPLLWSPRKQLNPPIQLKGKKKSWVYSKLLTA